MEDYDVVKVQGQPPSLAKYKIGALHFKVNFNTGNEKNNNCVRQEEPTILIFRFLLRTRRMYVASIPLEFH